MTRLALLVLLGLAGGMLVTAHVLNRLSTLCIAFLLVIPAEKIMKYLESKTKDKVRV